MIRRYPNGATHYIEDIVSARKQTRGTETSKYPEEKKTKVIPLVVASERGIAQTSVVTASMGLIGPRYLMLNELESTGK